MKATLEGFAVGVFLVVVVALATVVAPHTQGNVSQAQQKANCAHIVGDLSDLFCVER